MADAENTIQSSKKRVAGKELSRENPGLDDDEEEFTSQETGTFKRASDQVLANRRIVKVKRGQTSWTAAAPSYNPFAAIRLGNDGNTPASEKKNGENKGVLDENDRNTLASPKENLENKDKLDGNDKNTPASGNKEAENTGKVTVNDETTTTTEKEKSEKKEKVEGNDENTPGAKIKNVGERVNLEKNDNNTPTTVNSFKQLSSCQNAFSGLVGTGFSGLSFSSGLISKSDWPAFPSFSFGTNGNSSVFGNTDKKTEGNKTVPYFKHKVQVETGEENEKTIFTADSILFEYVDGGWKERGKGELKVNVLTSGIRKARLVMRAKGNYRLILNASIFPDMKLTNMDTKGITFACLNATGEGQNGLSTLALKFKDAPIVDEFRSIVMAHKGNVDPAIELKTPKNYPKAPNQ
ncbi:nuclear pore complex protein NUP50B-like isoform X2 [Bidens hawaiensis]|uniref:nuclear pore complex protein NUP50B-like isoform X2 n=1 Tax=Bidens hawaiensis TaxID=980011 RepID=UPI00404A362B